MRIKTLYAFVSLKITPTDGNKQDMKKAGFLQTGEIDRGFLPAVRCSRKETGAWNQEKTDSASPDAAGDSGVLVQSVPRAVSAEDTPFGTVPFDTGFERLWQPKPVLLMKGAPLSFFI